MKELGYGWCNVSVPLPDQIQGKLSDVLPLVRAIHRNISVVDAEEAHITVARLGSDGQPSLDPLIALALSNGHILKGGVLAVQAVDLLHNHLKSYIHMPVLDDEGIVERFCHSLDMARPGVVNRPDTDSTMHLTLGSYVKSKSMDRRYERAEPKLIEAVSEVYWEVPVEALQFSAWYYDGRRETQEVTLREL